MEASGAATEVLVARFARATEPMDAVLVHRQTGRGPKPIRTLSDRADTLRQWAGQQLPMR